jgi:hypothetical protein
MASIAGAVRIIGWGEIMNMEFDDLVTLLIGMKDSFPDGY